MSAGRTGDGCDLESALRDAHAADDLPRLAALYTRAAERAGGESDTACFFLTHAWVFAMAAGLDEADVLRARLVARGRV